MMKMLNYKLRKKKYLGNSVRIDIDLKKLEDICESCKSLQGSQMRLTKSENNYNMYIREQLRVKGYLVTD